MKNKLSDLNDHLFAQMERLSEEGLTVEKIAKEVTRTDALVKVSAQIINNANLVLRGAALVAEYGGKDAFQHLLPMMGGATKVIEGPKK